MENYEAFNGDKFLEKEFRHLIKKFDIKTIIECGTYLGQTTEKLSELVPFVETIEVREDFYLQAESRLCTLPNVTMHLGDSPKVLDNRLSTVKHKSPTYLRTPYMLFLDSHWSYPTPLKGEFEVIAKHGKPAVICIHDMQNPGDPTMGFDSYKDQEYTFEAIQPLIELVYGKDGYEYYFNKEAEGARRGALFICQKLDL